MKTKHQLDALIAFTRLQEKSGVLKDYLSDDDKASATNSWGPQMRG